MTTVSDEKPRATLSDKQARGGVIGGKGYGFQAAYIVSRIPLWLSDPDFAQFLQEGAGDVDVRFNRTDGEERWYVQVKDYAVTPATAREVFAQFHKADTGTPGTYTRFTLACPGLNEDLKRLRTAVEELRGAKDFFRPGQDAILDNTWADLESLVRELNLPVDARFLVDKAGFDTDLAGLTDDTSLCNLFVGSLLRLEAWARVPPEGAARAYEKLALLCHRALRQTCSREQVEALIREAVEEVPVKATHFTVPFMRNPDFVGRDEDLERLHQALMGKGQVGIRPAGLTGMAGIGKTQLAVEYAYRYAGAYPGGVFWTNAAEPPAQSFAQLGKRLQPATADRTLDEQVRAAAGYLRDHPDALLILDNLADPASLNRPIGAEVVPAALPCRILFTTRQRDLGRFQAVEVTVLPEDAALKLLLRHPSRCEILDPTHPEHEEAKTICAVLGYLPLALEVAATHLGRRPDAPLASYRKELLARGALPVLDDPRLLLRSEDLPTRHDAAVAATLAGQWENVENDDARLLLRVAGQLPEAAMIPTARLGLLAGLDDQEGGFFGSPLKLALQELADASLVEELRGKYVRLHPLVREFAAGRTSEEETLAFRRRCATNLARAYEDTAILEDHGAHRGVDALQEDLSTGLELCAYAHPSEAGDEAATFLQSLHHVLRREAHNLRGWDQEQRPAFFAQQVHARAVDLGFNHVVGSTEVRLAGMGQPYLALRWRAGHESPALVRTLAGHATRVLAVAVTPDGRYAISGSWDGTLKVWEIETGREVRTLAGHAAGVHAVAVTPDGRYAISASSDRTLKAWELETGREVRTLAGHEDWVYAVAVTPDGRYAISASRDRTLKVWELETGREVRTLAGHKSGVLAVAVTPDGRHAISGSVDRTLKVWELETGRKVRTLVGHEDDVFAVAVTPDGRYAISASADRTLKVWELETGRQVRTLAGHEGGVRAVALTPDGRYAISASGDRTLKVWELETGRKVRTLVGHEDDVFAVAVTPDGRYAISGSEDYTLKVWELETGRKVSALAGHKDMVWAVAVTPDGRYAISASDDCTLKVWELEMGREARTLAGHKSGVLAVAMTPDGRYAISASDDGTLKVWELETGRKVHTLAGHKSWVNDVAVTPDGRYAISSSNDGTLKVWELEMGWKARTLAGHEWTVNAVAVTPDGRHAISASVDRTLKVWEIETGREVHTLAGHKDWVRAVAVTPDGQYAISASFDHTLKMWELETGREVHTLAGHKDEVLAVAVTPDGRYAISASGDCTLKVWEIETGREVRTLAGHKSGVCAVAVTPDGRYAISASFDRRLKVWELETGRELATAALEGMVCCVAIAPDGVTVLAGDGAGNVYCLQYVEGNKQTTR